MKRWFEIVGQKQTMEIDLVKGSQSETASAEEISKAMCMDLKELTKSQYRRLTIQFTKIEKEPSKAQN